jgi:hypothetical protein
MKGALSKNTKINLRTEVKVCMYAPNTAAQPAPTLHAHITSDGTPPT